jgi:hypothetical protein
MGRALRLAALDVQIVGYSPPGPALLRMVRAFA